MNCVISQVRRWNRMSYMSIIINLGSKYSMIISLNVLIPIDSYILTSSLQRSKLELNLFLYRKRRHFHKCNTYANSVRHLCFICFWKMRSLEHPLSWIWAGWEPNLKNLLMNEFVHVETQFFSLQQRIMNHFEMFQNLKFSRYETSWYMVS